uniref:Uncharacterized protein n=1 Tax=Dulem virus 146 TaxID=3145623 RepID=A0AAU8AU73_9VIRU
MICPFNSTGSIDDFRCPYEDLLDDESLFCADCEFCG